MGNATIVIFIVLIFLSRFINNNAIKKLSTEKKAQLLDDFSNFGIWSAIPVLIVAIGIFLLMDYDKSNMLIYISVLAIVGFIYVIFIQIYIYKKLVKLDYPTSYIKQYSLSLLIRFFALVSLIAPVFLDID